MNGEPFPLNLGASPLRACKQSPVMPGQGTQAVRALHCARGTLTYGKGLEITLGHEIIQDHG